MSLAHDVSGVQELTVKRVPCCASLSVLESSLGKQMGKELNSFPMPTTLIFTATSLVQR
jgi:hypothetical protein